MTRPLAPMAARARLGRKPRAPRDVKDAHTRCNVGCAQPERNEVHRDVREGAVVLRRRLALETEFLGHPRPPRIKGAFSTSRWLDARSANHAHEPIGVSRRVTAKGHQDSFLRPKPSARYRFSQETFVGTHGNGRDAP